MNATTYIKERFAKEDDVLTAVRQGIKDRDMPSISVAPETGNLLSLLVGISGAKTVLEVGALGGYSGICLARALPADGRLVSLELKQEYADFAHENLKQAGYGDVVEYRVGEALDHLAALEQEERRFDFFFIDADKANYANYLEWAIKLANKGAVITADNVLWGGRVHDETNQEESTTYLRAFNDLVAADPRLEAMMVTTGDGLIVARVKDSIS
ncbi:O-methyltransferase [Tumebacillus sp. DT12]|uniref:O-methyltransferase n=1 Tax=Tumebacillus lacus TaxID=2995335 RepID=A0ABT3WVS5_9BACL|nr:O-methyltransferase [Tumebacillus lacus]MCX7568769.1 O-methyltransferase [Tumebacillus lacus]